VEKNLRRNKFSFKKNSLHKHAPFWTTPLFKQKVIGIAVLHKKLNPHFFGQKPATFDEQSTVLHINWLSTTVVLRIVLQLGLSQNIPVNAGGPNHMIKEAFKK
jgi:hypothetical protein